MEKKKSPYVYRDMHAVGVVLYCTGCCRLYKSSQYSCSALFRPWHPVTWLLLVLMVVPCAVMGEKLTNAVPMRLSEFWRLNAEQLQWVRPWTRMDTLKPFDHRRSRTKPVLTD